METHTKNVFVSKSAPPAFYTEPRVSRRSATTQKRSLTFHSPWAVTGCKLTFSSLPSTFVPSVNFSRRGPLITSLNNPRWFSPYPFFEASSRIERLNMSLPVKYSNAAPRSSQGTTRRSMRLHCGTPKSLEAPCHYTDLQPCLRLPLHGQKSYL